MDHSPLGNDLITKASTTTRNENQLKVAQQNEQRIIQMRGQKESRITLWDQPKSPVVLTTTGKRIFFCLRWKLHSVFVCTVGWSTSATETTFSLFRHVTSAKSSYSISSSSTFIQFCVKVNSNLPAFFVFVIYESSLMEGL